MKLEDINTGEHWDMLAASDLHALLLQRLTRPDCCLGLVDGDRHLAVLGNGDRRALAYQIYYDDGRGQHSERSVLIRDRAHLAAALLAYQRDDPAWHSTVHWETGSQARRTCIQGVFVLIMASALLAVGAAVIWASWRLHWAAGLGMLALFAGLLYLERPLRQPRPHPGLSSRGIRPVARPPRPVDTRPPPGFFR